MVNVRAFWPKLRSRHSLNRQIFWAAVATALGTVGARSVTLAKDVLVAHAFGRADALDAFFIALILPMFCINLVGSSFSAAFIPIFIHTRLRAVPQELAQLLSSVVALSFLALVLFAAAAVWSTPLWLPILTGDFGAAKMLLAKRLVLSLVPYLVFGGMAGVLTSVLNAQGKFGWPSLSTIFVPTTVIVCLVAWVARWGVYALSLGMGVGALLQCVVLTAATRRHFPALRFRIYRSAKKFALQVGGQYVPMLAGSVLMGCTTIVDQAMAARLPSGNVSALNYGNRVISALMLLGAFSISTAALPYFSDMVARSDWHACQNTMRTYVRLILAVATLGTVVLVVCSRPLVALLFQRGAFTASDTLVVARVQQALALQLPFYIAGMLYVRLISAMRANKYLLLASAIGLPTDVALNYLGMRWAGVVGIAAATSLMYLITFSLTGLFARRLLEQARRRPPVPMVAAGGAA